MQGVEDFRDVFTDRMLELGLAKASRAADCRLKRPYSKLVVQNHAAPGCHHAEKGDLVDERGGGKPSEDPEAGDDPARAEWRVPSIDEDLGRTPARPSAQHNCCEQADGEKKGHAEPDLVPGVRERALNPVSDGSFFRQGLLPVRGGLGQFEFDLRSALTEIALYCGSIGPRPVARQQAFELRGVQRPDHLTFSGHPFPPVAACFALCATSVLSSSATSAGSLGEARWRSGRVRGLRLGRTTQSEEPQRRRRQEQGAIVAALAMNSTLNECRIFVLTEGTATGATLS